jgi:hypothetical protein
MALRLLLLPSLVEKTEKEVEEFFTRGLSRDFWRHLGESGRIVFYGIKSSQTEPGRKPGAARISGYVVFGALLAIALNGRIRQKPKIKEARARGTFSVMNAAADYGVKSLGKRLGLGPVAKLMLTIVGE